MLIRLKKIDKDLLLGNFQACPALGLLRHKRSSWCRKLLYHK